MGEFSLSHLLIVGAVLLIFGPSRLPGLARGLGQSIRDFKKSLNEDPVPPPAAQAPAQQIVAAPAAPAAQPIATEVKNKDHV